MGITKYEQLAFQLLSFFHWYMWPLPLEWDRTNAKLVMTNQPFSKLLPFTFVVLLTWVLACMCLSVAIWMCYMSPKHELATLLVVIFVVIGALYFSFCIGGYHNYRRRKTTIFAFNELLALADEISKGKIRIKF